MNVENFFNKLNEKTWRQNMEFHAERKFDTLLEYLQENKEDIISEIVSDIKEMESMKNEDKEIFDYAVFEHWLEKIARNDIALKLQDDDDEED